MSLPTAAHLGVRPTTTPLDDLRPPGERYFRHPGDVLRLALWGSVAVVLALSIALGTATSEGLTEDFGEAVARVSVPIREFTLASVQLVVIAVPLILVTALAIQHRWRRLGVLLLAGTAGAGAMAGLDRLLDLPGQLPDAITEGTWVASPRFPSIAYLAGATAAAAVGKPWLTRPWRRSTDVSIGFLAFVMLVAGSAGVPKLALAIAAGAATGAAVLVIFGAPNRRLAPHAVADALRETGFPVTGLALQRAEGGRSQLYVADIAGDGDAAGDQVFLKVYGRDSRDADLLYRVFRFLLFRGPNDTWPSSSLKYDVEHEALLLVLARQGGVRCPGVQLVDAVPDGSMVLGLEHIDGVPLDAMPTELIDDQLLDATWREVQRLHDRRIAHRALRAGNVLVAGSRPVIIDLGFADESAPPRLKAIDRAELLTSLAVLVGPERAVASAVRSIGTDAVATTLPYLQPLALSAATRRRSSKSLLRDLRAGVETTTGAEPVELEQLVRVSPQTLVMIAFAVSAFYLLLPQLANVDDSLQALGDANWGWLVVSAVMSSLTYVASAVGLIGGVPEHLPLVPTAGTQLASSFVNRVTPANVGGMAVNVRYLQKAGVDPAEAVTGVGLNSLAGGIVHAILLVVFLTWAGQSGGDAFQIPSSSKLLVAIAVILALLGIAVATRRGRRLLRRHVLTFLQRSWRSMRVLARSPVKLLSLFGGSAGVTLAYTASLAAAVVAFDGGPSIAEIGAVYLGASVIAAAAPTPGGLGALEAALVAGLTGVGMEPGPAVAAVLSYRLVTYWLPILPGWIAFHQLERRGLI